MIQRIQTIFLLLAAVLNLGLFFAPVWEVSNPRIENAEGTSGEGKIATAYLGRVEYNEEPDEMSMEGFLASNETKKISSSENLFTLAFMVLVVCASAYFIFVIMMYSNRPRQMQLAYLGMVLICVEFLLLIPIRSYLEGMAGVPGVDYQSIPKWGMVFPLLALGMTWLAAKRIKKDEKMVRDMDRIR